jgi:polyvinyl alcohol dehydrogenase (cytochrome)
VIASISQKTLLERRGEIVRDIAFRLRRRGDSAVLAVVASFCHLGPCVAADLAAQSVEATSAQGEMIYMERCATCHDHAHGNIPMKLIIARKFPEGIVAALTTGPMRAMATGLSGDDIREVAIYVSGKPFGRDPPLDANPCPDALRAVSSLAQGDGDWPAFGPTWTNSRYQPHPAIDPAGVRRLHLGWAFAYPGGTAGSAPIALGGRLYLTTQAGLYALDQKTGCTVWHLAVGAGGTGIGAKTVIAGRLEDGRWALYFGDTTATVTALDALDGRVLWTRKVDTHPDARVTGPVTFFQNRIYVPLSSFENLLSHAKDPCCTFRGSVVALDAKAGTLLWRSYTISRSAERRHSSSGTPLFAPAGGAIYAPITIDAKRRTLYAVTAESYTPEVADDGSNAVIALKLDSGERLWIRQPRPRGRPIPSAESPDRESLEFSAPAVLVTPSAGRDLVLVGQKSGTVYGLDPDRDGEVVWESKIAHGGSFGGVGLGFSVVGRRAYVPISDSDEMPPGRSGGLVALDAASGRTLWRRPPPPPVCSWGRYGCSAAQPGASAAIPGVVFSGSFDGHIRAYQAETGAIMWDFDTGREFQAVNGVKATGGAVSGFPVTVANGRVFVTSGAVSLTHPGNALLAFSVDKP